MNKNKKKWISPFPDKQICEDCLIFFIFSLKSNTNYMKRVTGIGGIFFKCQNPKSMKDWYTKHLGFNTDDYGTSFEWRQADDANKKGFSVWSPFDANTKYFEPSDKEFMVNYRVENLEWLLEELQKEGVKVLDEIECLEYGKFAHIIDPEGNKIQLWEADDEEYDTMAEGRTK